MSLSEARLCVDARPNDLEAYWMPFTPNRAFKKAPRLITRAKDMYYYTADGRPVLDAAAGLSSAAFACWRLLIPEMIVRIVKPGAYLATRHALLAERGATISASFCSMPRRTSAASRSA